MTDKMLSLDLEAQLPGPDWSKEDQGDDERADILCRPEKPASSNGQETDQDSGLESKKDQDQQQSKPKDAPLVDTERQTIEPAVVDMAPITEKVDDPDRREFNETLKKWTKARDRHRSGSFYSINTHRTNMSGAESTVSSFVTFKKKVGGNLRNKPKFPKLLQPRTAEERNNVLVALGALPETDDRSELPKKSLDAEFYSKAKEACSSGEAFAIRFEHLAMLCLLQSQHQLIKMDEKLCLSNGVLEKEQDWANLRDLLRIYHECVWLVKDTNELTRPGVEDTKKYGSEAARRFLEPQYWFSADALNLFDLSRKPCDSGTDGLRRFIQDYIPKKLLDNEGLQRRKARNLMGKVDTGAGTLNILQALKTQPMHISPIVDKLARLTIAILGAMFLLLPMIIMTVVDTTSNQKVIVTVVFTVVFAMIIALSTRASNQEILAASAAYTAVLVVFVGAATAVGTQPSSALGTLT